MSIYSRFPGCYLVLYQYNSWSTSFPFGTGVRFEYFEMRCKAGDAKDHTVVQ